METLRKTKRMRTKSQKARRVIVSFLNLSLAPSAKRAKRRNLEAHRGCAMFTNGLMYARTQTAQISGPNDLL